MHLMQEPVAILKDSKVIQPVNETKLDKADLLLVICNSCVQKAINKKFVLSP